jgi:hypothetical protein
MFNNYLNINGKEFLIYKGKEIEPSTLKYKN